MASVQRKVDKKYLSVFTALGIAGILLCLLVGVLVFSSGWAPASSKLELKEGNIVTVRGKVTGFSNACAYDAECGVTITDTYYGSVFIVTSMGLTSVRCGNQNSLSRPLESYVGQVVEAKGKVIRDRVVLPCSSSEYVRIASGAE